MSRYIDADNLEHKIIIHRRIAIHKDDVLSIIADIPTAEVSGIVHGRWIACPDYGVAKCSVCDWVVEEVWHSDYCPNCGAKMSSDDGKECEKK